VLWAFAIPKPLFDVIADSPEFFVARGNTRGDILTFAFAAVLLVPTALVLIEAVFVRLPLVRRLLHLAFVAALASAFALQVADDALGAPSGVLLAIAAIAGVGVGVAYARTRFVPTVLTVLGPAPLLLLAWFLLLSPVSDLVLPQDVEEAAGTTITSETPVVFVVFDEFDTNMLMDARQRIDATRYPHFAAFARDGTWYRNASAVNSATTLAVPSVLSGRRAPSDSLPTQADFPNSVFTLLGGTYEFHVEEHATQLCPERLCGSRTVGSARRRLRLLAKDLGIVSLHLLLPEGLRSNLPAVDRTFGDFQTGGRDKSKSTPGDDLGPPASTVLDRAGAVQRLLDGISAGSDRPPFNFAHLILPHVPWQYLPTGQQYPPSEPDIPGLHDEHWDDNPVFAKLGLQRHLLQVGYADLLVGEVVDRLRRAGLYDRALVIFTADHGVSYRPGKPRRAPTPETLSDIGAVPLFIKYPGQRHGKVDDTMVRNIDIVPTVADTLGVELPYEAEGRPIRPGQAASRTVAVASGRQAPVTAPFPAFVRAREAGLRRIVSLFGSDDGGSGLYATGPGRDLLGESTRRLVTLARAPARIDLANAQVFAALRPGAAVIPSLLAGRVIGDVEAGTPIAVAVNGRVRGVSETFADGGETRLAVMVPPASFRPGRNRVDVLTIHRVGGRTELTALEVARPDYRIVDRDGGQVLVTSGADLPLVDGSVQGAVDDLKRDGPAIRIGGWAASQRAKRPATRVLVFARGRLLAQGVPDITRADIPAKWNTPAVAKSGYAFRVSGAGLEPDDIRVVALYRGDAAELPVYSP
jgi:Sulfatase